jgi:50S ribosomal protein L16 3-hydroxylase
MTTSIDARKCAAFYAQPIKDISLERPEEIDQAGAESEFALSSEFWQDFIENYWEKKPAIIKQPFARCLASSDEIFGALVKASDSFRAGDRSANMRFHTDHALLMSDVGKHIPSGQDRSVRSYARRVVQRMGCDKFDLMVNHLQVHNADLWLRLRAFFRPMYESVGFLPNNTEVVLFLRNYKATARGLHKDSASVFLFVIEGRKRMVAWPNEYFRDRREVWETLDYDRFLGDATVLEGEPGDILYWPASYWHVGESDDELSLSLSVGLHLKYKPVEEVLEQVTRSIESRFRTASGMDKYPFDPNNPQQSAETLPVMMQEVTGALKELESSRELEHALKLAWLKRVTGYSFPKVPLPLPHRRLADDDVIRGERDYPVIWSDWTEGRVAVSANGHPFVATSKEDVVRLITRLNGGQAHSVGELINRCAASGAPPDVEFLRGVLEKLYTLRAAIIVSGPGDNLPTEAH